MDNTITAKDGAKIYYKDWGTGQPLFFHHGWPLSADDWDGQKMSFLARGYRVIAHDRRGHARSSQTATGNEMDTYAEDLNVVVEKLDLRDAVHIGTPREAARWPVTERAVWQRPCSSARCPRSWSNPRKILAETQRGLRWLSGSARGQSRPVL